MGYKRKPGRPRKKWTDVVKQDLKDTDITGEKSKNRQKT